MPTQSSYLKTTTRSFYNDNDNDNDNDSDNDNNNNIIIIIFIQINLILKQRHKLGNGLFNREFSHDVSAASIWCSKTLKRLAAAM